MNRLFLSIIAMAFSCLACTRPVVKADYQVIPLPESIEPRSGEGFLLDNRVHILYPDGDEAMERNAGFLIAYVNESTDVNLKKGYGTTEDRTIQLTTGLQAESPEAYELIIDSSAIRINGASAAGVFYGIQTLRKSLPVIKGGKVLLPPVKISDSPRFGYRGMMLDVCRHFYTVEQVKTFIDILAMHNINRFHWHLTEDQGWRIEIKKYPELTRIGSVRKQTVIGKNTGNYDGIPHSGFYTQDEIREIVRYAQDRYITIIPEIDMPGHMQGALASYPELGCTGGPYEVLEKWGVSKDVLCAGNPKTLGFVKDVLSEVIGLFPSEYIHVGGDECPKDRWKECPVCQAEIRRLGLSDGPGRSKEDKLQGHFVSEVSAFLSEHGRKMIGWDEILEGGSPEDATVMVWRNIKYGIDAMELGHDVIMTPSSHLYFDHYQALPKDEPFAIGGYSPLKKVYGYDPCPEEVAESLKSHVIGTQANLWTEYIPDFNHLLYMMLPRMDALSEIQWTRPELKDWDSFTARMPQMFSLYDRYGFNYARHIFEVRPTLERGGEDHSIKVSLETMGSSAIYYTLDGTHPTLESPVYTEPLLIKKDAVVSAIAVHPNGDSPLMRMEVRVNSLVEDIKLLTSPEPQYTFTGAGLLIDGMTGIDGFGSGEWLGFCNNEMVAEITLDSPHDLSLVSFDTYIETGAWVFDARHIKIETSIDGRQFTTVAEKDIPSMEKPLDNARIRHDIAFDATASKFVRITVVPENQIPAWHDGKGQKGFLFIDEIFVR